MNDSGPIQKYLAELADSLAADRYPSARILREVEDHLRERVDQLLAAGWECREAEVEAIARFGATHRVASQFQQQPALPCEEEIMIRRSLTGLVVVTAAYAALHVIFSLFNEPTAVFTYVKIAFAAIVVVTGMLILHWQWRARRLGEIERIAIFIGGLSLIEIGTANMVWTAHLGLVSGDWEYYGFVGGAMISFLGSIAVLWLAFPDLLETKHDLQRTA